MVRFFSKVRLLFYFFLLANCSLTFSTEINFFDVGQGNCTVVHFLGGSPLLVDAGFSNAGNSLFESSGRTCAVPMDERVAEKIKTYLASSGSVELNIVVSHGDKDHANLVNDVIENIRTLIPSLEVSVVLGGTKENYKSKDYKGTILHPEYKLKIKEKRVYAEEVISGTKAFPGLCPLGFKCNILAALALTGKDDKNDNSIVLRIESGAESVILTGDATKKTTDAIAVSFPKTTILQASHHGADSDGSNSDSWFKATKPEYIIISSGSSGYGHPRQEMLKRALKIPTLVNTYPPHLLQYCSDWSFIDTSVTAKGTYSIDTVGRATDDYLCGLTSLGLFSTASKGDIHFDFSSGNFTFFREALSTVYEVMERFLKSIDREETTSITFPTIDFTKVGGPDFKSFTNLMELIVKGYTIIGTGGKKTTVAPITGLVSCDLSRVALLDTDMVTPYFFDSSVSASGVINQLIGLSSLQQLDLPAIVINSGSKKHVPIDLDQKKDIKAAWAKAKKLPRALRFIES